MKTGPRGHQSEISTNFSKSAVPSILYGSSKKNAEFYNIILLKEKKRETLLFSLKIKESEYMR